MSNPTIYDQATSAVVKMLETAGTNWCQPWQVNGSRNVVTDKQYRGINTLILASTPYPSGTWGTFKQWKHLGHPVRKGQKSTGIAFFKPITKETPVVSYHHIHPSLHRRVSGIWSAILLHHRQSQ